MYKHLSQKSLGGDEEGQPINYLTLFIWGAVFVVLAVSVSIKTMENQLWKAPEDGGSHSGLAFIPRGV